MISRVSATSWHRSTDAPAPRRGAYRARVLSQIHLVPDSSSSTTLRGRSDTPTTTAPAVGVPSTSTGIRAMYGPFASPARSLRDWGARTMYTLHSHSPDAANRHERQQLLLHIR